MEFLKHIIWTYPAAIMTSWTLMTALAAWTMRRNRPIPFIFSMHAMLMLLNPKDNYLYQRPSAGSILFFLVAGLLPVVSLLLLLAQFAMVVVGVNTAIEDFCRKIGKPKRNS